MELPHAQAAVRHANDLAHSFAACVQRGMPQDATREGRRLILPDGQADQAVASMTQGRLIKSEITREERYGTQAPQERNDLLVRHTLSPKIVAEVTDPDPPASQQLPLAFRNVLIKDRHEPVIRRAGSAA